MAERFLFFPRGFAGAIDGMERFTVIRSVVRTIS